MIWETINTVARNDRYKLSPNVCTFDEDCGKQIYFKMVWYWNKFCKKANIWYPRTPIFKTGRNFGNLFLKAQFVIKQVSRSQLLSETHHYYIFNRIGDTNLEKLNNGFVRWILRWERTSVDEANFVHSCALRIWLSYFVLQYI